MDFILLDREARICALQLFSPNLIVRKSGFVGIYNEVNSKILPVAVNSGLYWPKHTFIKTSGKIIIKILKPIPSNLQKNEVLKELETVIEEETNKIIQF